MYALLVVTNGIVGLFSFVIIAVVFEFAAEMTYPVAEGTTTGFLWLSAQIQAIFFIFIADAFHEIAQVCWLYFVSMAFATITTMFIKTKYLRIEAEKQLNNGEFCRLYFYIDVFKV